MLKENNNVIEKLQKQVSEYVKKTEEVTKLINLIDSPQQ